MPQIQTLWYVLLAALNLFSETPWWDLVMGCIVSPKKVCSNTNPGTCEGNVIRDFADVIKLR